MSDRNPVTTLTGSGETDPFHLAPIASDVCFTITGPSSGTITVFYSNVEGTKVAADWCQDPVPITSFPAGPFQIPFGTARYVKFVGTSVVGTAAIRWARGKDERGNLADVGVEAPRQQQVTA